MIISTSPTPSVLILRLINSSFVVLIRILPLTNAFPKSWVFPPVFTGNEADQVGDMPESTPPVTPKPVQNDTITSEIAHDSAE